MKMQSTLGERLYEVIRQDIFAGKYKPGERLFFEQIAKDSSISMTPVKEAFMLLEREGLVVTIARKGTFVREITPRDLVEYVQIRLALELLAAELICENGLSAEDETRFEEICAQLEQHIKEEDAKNCVFDDVLYHRQLIAASGSKQLRRVTETMPFINLLNLMQKAKHYLEHGEYFLKEHRKIVRLLKKRDMDGLRSMLIHHISGQYSNLAAFNTKETNEVVERQEKHSKEG